LGAAGVNAAVPAIMAYQASYNCAYNNQKGAC
jgi:hypothetical protein